jgi:hypothetical protein
LKTEELARQLKAGSFEEQINIDGERFYTRSFELAGGRNRSALSFEVIRRGAGVSGKENRMLAGLGLLAVLAGGRWYFISDRFTRPLWSLVEGVRALENGDYEYPLNSCGTDEVAHVTLVSPYAQHIERK